MSSLLGSFILGTDVLSGSQGSLADLITSIGSHPTWLANDRNGNALGVSVEIAIPSNPNSILGQFILGTSVLSGLDWYPVTDRWIGAQIDRGSEDGSANVGTMSLTLDNTDGTLSPWSSSFPHGAKAYAGPGTLVRVSTFSGYYGNWFVQFCGVVESWNVVKEAFGRTLSVEITAAETTTQLAQVNDIALTSAVGAGELTTTRIQRLLDAASWPFGLVSYSGFNTAHQATVLSQNRLSECYLTADSAVFFDSVSRMSFRADRTGAAYIGPEVLDTPQSFFTTNFVSADSLILANDGELVTNVVSLATVGGTVTTWTNGVSIGRYGRQSTQRMDLNATVGTDLTPIANDILGKGSVTLRPVSMELDIQNDHNAPHLVDLNIAYNLKTEDGLTFSNYRVAAISHTMRPMGATDIEWTCNLTFRPTATASQT